MVPMNHNNNMSRNIRNHLITYTFKYVSKSTLRNDVKPISQLPPRSNSYDIIGADGQI
jgi:hypothetical protein